MKRLVTSSLLLLLLTPMVTLAEAASKCKSLDQSSALALLQKVQSSYDKLSSFEAEFKQKSYMVGLDESRESSGKMAFQKTAKMDWSYLEPNEQRFVTDGKDVWFYQPELNQVSVGDFKQAFSSELPVSFLLGLSSLDETFKLSSSCEGEGDVTFFLEPRSSDGSIATFELGVLKRDFLPRVARIVDVGGNENTITLAITKIDEELDEKRFKFEIPKGVDVLEQRDHNLLSAEE